MTKKNNLEHENLFCKCLETLHQLNAEGRFGECSDDAKRLFEGMKKEPMLVKAAFQLGCGYAELKVQDRAVLIYLASRGMGSSCAEIIGLLIDRLKQIRNIDRYTELSVSATERGADFKSLFQNLCVLLDCDEDRSLAVANEFDTSDAIERLTGAFTKSFSECGGIEAALAGHDISGSRVVDRAIEVFLSGYY